MSREIAIEGGPLVAISTNRGPRAHYSWNGFYDDNIVCSQCESLFKAADDYAIEFRRDALYLRRSAWPMKTRRPTHKLLTFKANPELLHRFALQTWLRATLSDRYDFEAAKPGWISEHAASCLLGSAPTLVRDAPEVSYNIIRDDRAAAMTSPVVSDVPGYPLVLIPLPHMTIQIATSSNGLPPGFKEIALRSGEEVTVWRPRHLADAAVDQHVEMLAEVADRVEHLFSHALRNKR
ncbi:hypothetical protein [Lysobacter enzymogenes]|uniref:hypothetical protein n=1 Tax=Lysobacter enzymogenes TaxID=69 RepID=UPI00339AD95A